MKNLMSKFLKEEEGNVIEYVIVLAVVAVIIVALFPGLRGKLVSWFNGMIGNVDNGLGGGNKGGINAKCTIPGGTTQGTIQTDGTCA